MVLEPWRDRTAVRPSTPTVFGVLPFVLVVPFERVVEAPTPTAFGVLPFVLVAAFYF